LKKATDYSNIYKKYGEMSEYDAWQVSRAEKQLEKCAKCEDFPCAIKNDGYKPVVRVIDGYGVEVAYTPCKILKAKETRQRLSKLFKESKLPSRYIGKSFEDYEVTAENEQAVKLAKKIVKNPQFGMYVYGKPGTGKTLLSAIMAQELIKAGKTVIFGDVPSVLDDLKSTFDGGGEQKISRLMEMLSSVDMLVLDDLGTEIPTEWAVERLYKIVNDRYNADKPLIITSNFMPDTVAHRMNHPKKKESTSESVTGDRIISRLLQMCKGVTIKGKDRRF